MASTTSTGDEGKQPRVLSPGRAVNVNRDHVYIRSYDPQGSCCPLGRINYFSISFVTAHATSLNSNAKKIYRES